MFLGTRTKILSTIQHLFASSDSRADRIRVAVAFWGAGSELFIKGGGQFELLCNLGHPGTNPWVIEKIRAFSGVKIRRLDELHAKVIIGSAGAFIGSANFSERALGIQRSDIAGWVEAGVFINSRSEEHSEANVWFETVWGAASEITDDDIAQAKVSWTARGGEAMLPTEKPLVTQARDTPAADAPPLFEEQVFETEPLSRSSGNRTRMASKKLEYMYYQAFPSEERNKATIKVPAHAANLLWTLSGQCAPTNITSTPMFKTPEMVLERAAQMKTLEKLHAFMAKLAHSREIRPEPAVRYWAQQHAG